METKEILKLTKQRESDVFGKALMIIEQYRKFANKEDLTIVIDGMCASGKSTLGQLLHEVYGGNLFHMDDFFLQPHQRTEKRLAEPGGNIDYERFQKEVIEHLENKQGFHYGIFDCGEQCIVSSVEVSYEPITIIEGSYSAHPYFGDVADLQFFLEVDKDEQMKRIRQRNGEQRSERFQKEWIPMENRYCEAFGIKEKSICLKTDGEKGIL